MVEFCSPLLKVRKIGVAKRAEMTSTTKTMARARNAFSSKTLEIAVIKFAI